MQDVEFGLFVLEHALLRRDACLQVQDSLLVGGGGNGINERLERREPLTGVGQRLARQYLQRCGETARGLEFRALIR